MDTKNISGKNHLYIDDARKSQAIAYNVDGATEQQTYTGKNLFNPSNTQTSNGITSTKNIDGSLSYSGTASAVWCDLTSVIPLSIPSGTTLTFSIDSPKEYRVVIYFDTSNTDRMIIPIGDTSVTLTTTAAHTQVKINFDRLTTDTSYSGKMYPQLEEGSTATDFEPYVGGTSSPNPDYPQEVKTIPSIMNLFDKDNANLLNCNMSQSVIGVSSNAKTLYIHCKPNTTYTISKAQVTSRFKVGTTATTPANTVPVIDYISNDGGTNITITTSSTVKYLCVYYYLNGTDTATEQEILDSIMIEESSVVHEYVPYGYYSKVKVTGKNLFNPTIQYYNYFGVTATINNQQIIFNGTSTNGGTSKMVSTPIPAGTYTMSFYEVSGTHIANKHIYFDFYNGNTKIANPYFVNTSSKTITLASTADSVRVGFVKDDTFEDYTFIVQLEENEVATTYEPYKENQVLIDMSKENLLNIDELDFYNAYYDGSGNIVESANDGMVQYIDAEPNTFYTLTKDVSTRNIWIVEFNESKTFIKRTARYDTSVADDFVLPVFTDSATKYLAIFGNYNNQPVTKDVMKSWNAKLYRSNNPTPYHELCKMNTYQDTLSIDDQGNCIINKRINKRILNGNENWNGGSFQTSYRYRTNLSDATSPTANDLNIYSNYFHASSNVLDTNITTGEIAHYKSSKDFYFSSNQTNVNDFKTWLSTHNTEVYYVLNKPETITLKNTPLPLFSGINHITFVDDLETDTTLVYENDISHNDKQALIDGTATIQTEIIVHSDNLFDKDNIVKINGTIGDNNDIFFGGGANYAVVVSCKPNMTYTVQKRNDGDTNRFALASSETIPSSTPDVQTTILNDIRDNDASILTLTTGNTANYLIVQYYRSAESTLTEQQILDSIVIEEDVKTLTETNSVIDWNHEDFRQVKDEEFIGQFVARQVTGNLHNLDDDFKITDKELELKLGVRTNNNTNWYSLGNFLTTKVSDDEVGDKTNFEALDYTKKFNKEYEDRVIYPCTALTLAKDVCDQCGVELGNFDFKNNDYVIDGNYFTNNESCRDVMKAIGKLAFSWVRCDWDNKVYIDFNPTPFITNQTPETCDTIGNNKYYNLKTQKEVYGPVDKVVIGYSAIEGERTYIGNENGTCVINVFDNPLVYNQEQRAAVIEAAYSLLGMTYTPLNTQTIGHPWLRADEPVKINDMESVSHITMPLDRTIQYFGHIKTLINSTTETKTNDSLSYKTDMVKNYERSEIYNDQNNKQIGIILEEQDNTNSRLNDTISTLDGTIQRVSKTETNISDIVTTTQVSTGKNHLYLEDACESNALNYRFDGATEQQTYTGKNLWELPSSDSKNGITYTKNINGTFKLNGTASANTDFTINIPYENDIFEQGATYTISKNSDQFDVYISHTTSSSWIGNLVEIPGSTLSKSFTMATREGATRYSLLIRVPNGRTINNLDNLTIQLEKSSTATDFEPYVGGTPSPNPDYPQYVDTIPNVNLFNASKQEGVYGSTTYTVASDGLITQSATDSTAWSPTQAKNFTLNPGTYTISITGKNSSTYMQLRNITDSTDLVLSRSSQATFVITEQKQVGFKLYGGGSDAYPQSYYVMLEKGSVAHTYIPFGCYAKVRVTGENMCNHSLTVNLTSGSEKWSSVSLRDIYWENGKTYYIGAFFTKQSNETAQITNYSYTTIANKVVTFTFNGTIPNVRVGANTLNGNIVNEDVKIMVSTEEFTEYEPYKENVVLINMSKENLFDSSNANVINGYIQASTSKIISGSNDRIIYIPCKSNATYSISKIADTSGNRFRFGTTVTEPQLNDIVDDFVNKDSFNDYTYQTNSTAKYLVVYMWSSNGTVTADEMLASIKIYESNNSTPYYELCKIGDYKDTLSIDSSGNVVVNKNVGKVVLNGTESWTSETAYTGYYRYKMTLSNTNVSDGMNNMFTQRISQAHGDYEYLYIQNNGVLHIQILQNRLSSSSVSDFKTWLSTHNTDVYYVLATPEIINLPNTKIPLFEGINHVTLIDDLETDTTISYYRKTPLSGTYATVTQLNNVSTEKTTEIQTVRKELLFEVSNERVRINAINETIDETGVPIVKTDTGYTFDIDGMKIEKGENDVSTIVDNDGLAVSYQNTEMLTVRSSGVEAENITTRKFYVQKPIRMEKTKSISDGSSIGLGFYYVGE